MNQIIYWSGDPLTLGIAHLISNEGSGTLTLFNALGRLLRQDFPYLKPQDINCGRITDSSEYGGHAVVLAAVVVPARLPKGWVVKPFTSLTYNY